MDYDHQAEFARTYNLASPPALEYFGVFAPHGSAFGDILTPVKAGFYLASMEHKSLISHSDEFINGRIYIQDYASFETAYILATLLQDHSELEVLDMCAAPGGKTNALYWLLSQNLETSLKNLTLAANEANKKRFFTLKKQLDLLGVRARVFNHDGVLIGKKCPERFDAVLLDAPCSCNAHDFSVSKSAKEIKKISTLQKKLLHSALLACKPNGIIIYSTCSYNEEENESVLQNALNSKIPCKMLDISSNLKHLKSSPTSLRIIPDKAHSGFFIAALQRI